MGRVVAAAEAIHVYVVARHVDDRWVAPLAQVESARGLGNDDIANEDTQADTLVVDRDSVFGILFIGGGKCHVVSLLLGHFSRVRGLGSGHP